MKIDKQQVFLFLISFSLLSLVLVPSVQAVSVTNVNESTCDCNIHEFNHTVSGTDKMLIVEVSLDVEDSAKEVESVTWEGTDLSLLNRIGSSGKSRISVWNLTNPVDAIDGTISITIEEGNSQKQSAASITLIGVNQGDPIDGIVNNSGDSTTATVSVTTTNNDLAMSAVSAQSSLSVAGGELEIWNLEMSGSSHFGAGSNETGDGSIDLDWTLGASQVWAIVGFNIKGLPKDTLTVCSSGCDSTTIQGAIDSAGDYTEVRVIEAIEYRENVTVNVLGLTLTANTSTKPVIWANWSTDTVRITSDDTKVDNFEIVYNGTTLDIYSVNASSRTNVTIENNTVNNSGSGNSGYGIYFTGTTSSFVTNNTVSTSGGSNNYGIYLLSTSDSNIIQNNTIATGGTSSSNYGIHLSLSDLNNVTDNIITTGGIASNYGIHLTSTSISNIIQNNTIATGGTSSSNYGIYLVSSSNINNITDNTITTSGSNSNYGIYLSSSGTDSNIIHNNTITTSGTSSSNYGIYLSTADFNNITSNNITTDGSSANYGIRLTVSDSNTFRSNNVTADSSGGNNHGVYLEDANTNTFYDDMITATDGNDVRLVNGAAGDQNFFVNVSFDKSDINGDVTGDLIKLFVQYRLDVLVQNSSSEAISDADVFGNDTDSVDNIENPTSNFSATTNSTGYIPQQILTEFLANSTQELGNYLFFTNYTINTTKLGFNSNLIEINMTSSRLLTITLTEEGAEGVETTVQANETFSMTEDNIFGQGRNLGETISFTDTNFFGFTSVVSQIITLIDSVELNKVLIRLSDAILNLSETVSLGIAKLFSDTFTITESVSLGIAKVFSDILTLTESNLISQILTRFFSDTLTISESINLGIAKLFSDTFTITESISLGIAKVVSDTLSLTESVSLGIAKVFSDILTLTESNFISQTLTRFLSDTLTISESINLGIAKLFSDSLTLIDSVLRQLGQVFSQSESLTLSESINLGITKAISDILTITESNLISQVLTKFFSDTLTLLESVNLGIARVISDTFTITESISLGIAKVFSETLTLLESINLGIVKFFSETLNLIAVIELGKTLTLSVNVILTAFQNALGIQVITIQISQIFTLTQSITTVFTEFIELVVSFSGANLFPIAETFPIPTIAAQPILVDLLFAKVPIQNIVIAMILFTMVIQTQLHVLANRVKKQHPRMNIPVINYT